MQFFFSLFGANLQLLFSIITFILIRSSKKATHESPRKIRKKKPKGEPIRKRNLQNQFVLKASHDNPNPNSRSLNFRGQHVHNYHCLWLVSVSSSHLEWMVRLSISPDCFQYPFIVQGDWENLSHRNSLASPAQSKTRPGLSSHLDLQGISHQLPDPDQQK